METSEATNAAALQPAAEQKPYLIVCADMACYNSREQIIGCYELVYTCSTDEYAACDQARRALPEGGIPLVAFNREDLERVLAEMLRLELKPGQAYNWSQNMTDVEIQAAYADVSDDEEKI